MNGCLSACMSVHYVIQYLLRPEEDFSSPGIGVPEGGEPPCGWWKSNKGPQEELSVLVIAASFLRSPSFS